MDKFALIKKQSVERMDFDWGHLLWYAGGASKSSDEMTLGRCVLKPGQANPKHYHPNCEEILHVLSGKIDHFVDGQGWLPMVEGDTITIPQGVWHHARNTGETDAHLLIAFSSADRKTVGEV